MANVSAYKEVETAPVFTEERINVLRKLLVTSFQRLKCGYEMALESNATGIQRQHANTLLEEFQEVLINVHEEYARSTTPTENLVHYANILFQEISVYDKSVSLRFPEFPEDPPGLVESEGEEGEEDEEEEGEDDAGGMDLGKTGANGAGETDNLEETVLERVRNARQITIPPLQQMVPITPRQLFTPESAREEGEQEAPDAPRREEITVNTSATISGTGKELRVILCPLYSKFTA